MTRLRNTSSRRITAVATQADLVIDAPHAGDDQLAPLVRSFTPDQLTQPTAEGE